MSTHDRGTGTFIRQRLTAITNIPLILFFIWLVVNLAGASRAEMAETFSNPFIAILTLLLLVSVLVHMRIGMGEIIEDYVHAPRLHSLAMALNTLFTVVVGLAAATAVFVLAFGG